MFWRLLLGVNVEFTDGWFIFLRCVWSLGALWQVTGCRERVSAVHAEPIEEVGGAAWQSSWREGRRAICLWRSTAQPKKGRCIIPPPAWVLTETYAFLYLALWANVGWDDGRISYKWFRLPKFPSGSWVLLQSKVLWCKKVWYNNESAYLLMQ